MQGKGEGEEKEGGGGMVFFLLGFQAKGPIPNTLNSQEGAFLSQTTIVPSIKKNSFRHRPNNGVLFYSSFIEL